METTPPQRQRLVQRLFMAALLLPALLHGYAIDYGSTREEVLYAYGSPPSKASSPKREIWTYREGQVILENGVVVEFRFSKGEPPLINEVVPAITEAPKPAPPPKPNPKPAVKPVGKTEAATPPAQVPTQSKPRPISSQAGPQPNAKPAGAPSTPVSAPLATTQAETASSTADAPEENPSPASDSPKGGEPGSGLGWWMLGLLGLGALVLILLPKRDKTRPRSPLGIPRTPEEPQEHKPEPPLPQLVFLTREVIYRVEWRAFEELVRRYFETQGWIPQRVKVAKDGSTDVLLFREGAEKPEAAVLCKPWCTRSVTAQDLYSFAALVKEEGYPKGYVVITSDFSADARVYAGTARLELISGDDLLQRFKYLPEVTHTGIIKQVLHGDYETPTCPNCETKMVRSQQNALFWNCPDYPHCSYSFQVRRDNANTKALA